jgi:YHS domain-containing protein
MSSAIDPVCGMEVQVAPEALTLLLDVSSLAIADQVGRHRGATEPGATGERFYFCGRGCLLDFQDEPERFLDAAFQPSGM